MRASLARMGRLNIWNYLLGRAGRHYTEARTRLRTGPPGIRPVGRSLELWNRIQFLECRGERIRKTPDRSRSELLVLRLEVEVMYAAGKVLWSLQSALDKCLVDDHLGGDVRQFTSLPGFHLLSHRLKVSLHSININRNAVDERERLRVFREHRREHAWDNASELEWSRTIR